MKYRRETHHHAPRTVTHEMRTEYLHLEPENTRVAVHFQGKGVPLVFLHSSACDHRQWRHLIAEWCSNHQFVLPDLPGCGRSDVSNACARADLSGDAGVVAALARRLNRPFHLIGHSYGGAVALKAAAKGIDDLASLTLIEPTCFHLLCRGDRFEHALFAQIEAVAEAVETALLAGSRETAMARFADYWSGPGSWRAMARDKRKALLPRADKLPYDFRALFNDGLTSRAISAIPVPTLILCGTQSPEPTRALSRLIAELIPQSRHRSIPRAGHMLPVTHPDVVSWHMARHLALPVRAAA